MAIHAQGKPFPLTPYPFQQFDANVPVGLASISEWLDLPEQSEGYHPEDNALTPEEWVACDGQEDATWVVGEPDWLEEGTKQNEVVSGDLSRPESSSSSGDSTTSISDVTSPHDTNTNLELPQGQTEDHSLPIDIPDRTVPHGLGPMRGVIRRRDSEEEIPLPERKRPRLERLVIDQTQRPIASPRGITPPQIQYNPTPTSPERQFYRILAEKSSKDGVMFKVVWRESWVHESKMPDIEPIRRAQYAQMGVAWDVLPGINSAQY